jgi:hypothetical protein
MPFIEVHPLWKTYDSTIHIADKKDLPDELYELLEGKPETGYNKGFVTMVNPDTYREVFALWDLEPAECTPFLKFAFGQFIFFHHNEYKILDPVYNTISMAGKRDDLKFVMHILLSDEEGLKNAYFKSIYFSVVDKLGAPAPDECYAFVPALGLGGAAKKGNVKKTKLITELTILSQL